MDSFNHLTPILPIPASQPSVASPSAPVLAQHTRWTLNVQSLSVCVCVCRLLVFIHIYTVFVSVCVTHPVILMFAINSRFFVCVCTRWQEHETSQQLDRHQMWHRNCLDPDDLGHISSHATSSSTFPLDQNFSASFRQNTDQEIPISCWFFSLILLYFSAVHAHLHTAWDKFSGLPLYPQNISQRMHPFGFQWPSDLFTH